MTPIKQTDTGARPAPRAPGQIPTARSRAQRARALRRRVISGALALFVATWLLIAVVLVSGHDPALARKTTVASTAGAQTTGTTATSGSTATKASGSTTKASGSTTKASGSTTQASGSAATKASSSTAKTTGSTASTNSSGSSVSGVTTRQS